MPIGEAIPKYRQLHSQETPWPENVTGWARALMQLGSTDEAFAKFAEECRGEIVKGKAKPLRLRDL